MATKMTRRSFLKVGAVGAASAAIMPGTVLGAAKKKGAKGPVRVAGVGIGGRGAQVLKELAGAGAQIVALCDVNHKYAATTFKTYPEAKKYWDYREMLREMGGQIDAVLVATADHTHAMIAAEAIAMGKHVYCEKPLTHSVYESRLLTKLAAKHGVVTQMGNQGSSGDGVAEVCDWIWNGEIGEVTYVEAFTDRPIWPQGLLRPAGQPVPDTLNWDLFIGPAEMKPYNDAIATWNWRGWWDYGTGALGDMACHILHPVFKGLKLGYPTKVQGSSTALLTECAPTAQRVELTFPSRDNMAKVALPEVKVVWYDGGLQPPRPEGVPQGRNLNDAGGGVIFHGTKDTLFCGCYGRQPWLLSGRTPNAPKVARRVPGENHAADFLRACQEPAATRVKTNSDFSEAGPFNEMVVMGVLAVRLQGLNKILEWDGENMKFTNIGADEQMRMMISPGFTIEDGHPSFNQTFTEPFNALEFANGLIKHNYREGWKLVDMPL